MADMTLEEALAAATADDGSETVYCTVDDDTRLVTVPDKYKKLGVESDEKAKRIWFRFPKLVGNNGVNLSAIGVRVNFRNANGDGDIYIVEDLTTDGDYVTFSWELTRKVTAYKGHVSFVVCAVKSATDGTTKNEWNTTLNKECEVLEGLEVSEQIAQENPDIIEYILANLGGSVSSEEIARAVEAYMEGHPSYAVEYQPQTLSDDQKQQARTNIGAASFDEIPSKTSDLQNDSGFLTEHQDLYNYALKSEIPKTAADVGAEASGTAERKVSEHSVSLDAHNDIRELISGLTQRLNALADSDDTALDQMSEVVACIKSNKSLIDAITTSKINVSDIIDNLTTNVSNKPLSAAQGVALKALIDAIVVPTKMSELENDSGYAKTTDIPDKLPNPQKLTFSGAVTAEYDGLGAVTVTIPEGSGGTGLSTEAIDKLEEVGNYLVYTTADGGSKWTELIDILRNGSSGGGSGETVTLQSISATYTGGEVTTGTALSDLTGIIVTATYSDGTTKTVTGYTLSGEILEGENTITVSYSGLTTTFTVTGIVESGGGEATAELPTDGLVSYFDFRTCEYNNAGSGGSTLIQPTQGNGQLFTWANNVVIEQNDYGMKTSRGFMFDENGGTTQSECGESFTWVFKCYLTSVASPMFSADYGSLNNSKKINYRPKYNTSSSTAQVAQEGFGVRTIDAYDLLILVVDNNICKLYFENELIKEIDGSSIDGFVSWYSKLSFSILGSNDAGYFTQLAIYNKALSDVEIAEMQAYLKTLEVA